MNGYAFVDLQHLKEMSSFSQVRTGAPIILNEEDRIAGSLDMHEKCRDKKSITIPLTEYRLLKRKAYAHDVLKKSLERIFTPGQINSIMKPNTSEHRARWSAEDIAAAMELRNITPKGYRYLRNTVKFPLPSFSTLRKWTSKVKDKGVMSVQEDFKTLSNVSPVLTDELVSKALSDWFKEEIFFSHWEYVGEATKGDSYLSDVMRIKIYGSDRDGKTKHVQVFLKTIPKNICRRLTYRSEEFFRNEISFYNTVLPGLLKFQSTKDLKEPYKSYVNVFLLYYDNINAVICLEDATLLNYSGVVRQEGIGFKHCQAAFKSLAQLHALSIAMKDQQPEQFDEIKNSVFETYYDDHLFEWYEKFWSRICGIAIDAVEKEFPNSIYEKKIKEFATPERYKDMIRAVRTHDTGVITHGDTWVPNFLFKFENEVPVDVKIIDFQLTRCATPVLDLTFFIYSCTSQDMRDNFYDDLLAHYYAVLSEQIRDLGSDPNKVYSHEKFMEEIKMYSYFGLGFSFESMPFTVLSEEDCFEMSMEGNQKRNIADFWLVKPYKTKEDRLRAAHNVVFCVDRGYI